MFPRRIIGGSSNGGALGFVRKDEFRPAAILPGISSAQAPHGELNARLAKRETPGGLTVSQAKEIVDGLAPAPAPSPPLNARTGGRTPGYLRSVLRGVAHGLGYGGGSARKVNAKWTPGPGQPAAAPQQGAMERKLRKQYTAQVEAQGHEHVNASGVQARVRQDARDVVYAATAPAASARQDIQASAGQASTEHSRRVIEVVAADKIHRHATNQLSSADAAVKKLGGARAKLLDSRSQLAGEISANQTQRNELKDSLQSLPPANAKMYSAVRKHAEKTDALASSTGRLHQHQQGLTTAQSNLKAAMEKLEQHAGLPAAAEAAREAVQQAQTDVDFQKFRLGDLDQPSRKGGGSTPQGQLLRGTILGRLQAREENLQAAQAQLNGVLQKIGSAGEFTRKEALLQAAVHACHQEVKHAQNVVELMGSCVRARQAAVTRAETRLNYRIAKDGAGGIESSKVEMQIEALDARNTVLKRKAANLENMLRENEVHLTDAKTAYSDAKNAVKDAKSNLDKALRAKAASLDRRDGLEAQLQRLAPLLEPRAKSDHEVEQALIQVQTRRQQKIQELQNAPPGFEGRQSDANLKHKLGELAQRFEVSAGLNDRQVRAFGNLIPGDQALEIISRSLARSTEGKADQAAKVLGHLMGRPLADLVPRPGESFSDQPQTAGNEQAVNSASQRTAGALLELPGGRELLKRLVQPAAQEPSAQVQDAVAVYFKATGEMGKAADEASLQWLQDAAEASKALAHPSPAGVSNEAAMLALTLSQKAAFTGVQNGLTSIGSSSTYEKVNSIIEKSLGDGLKRAAENKSRQTSPWHGRRLLSTAATHVNLPTVEADLNKQLKVACDELLRVTGKELIVARTAVSTARRMAASSLAPPLGSPFGPQTEVPEALIEAHNALHHIKNHLERGEIPVLDQKAWRSIEKETQRQKKVEFAVTTGSQGPLSEALSQAGSNLPGPRSLHKLAPPQLDYDTLQAGISELKTNKSTNALQAMKVLSQCDSDLNSDDETATMSMTSDGSASSFSSDDDLPSPNQGGVSFGALGIPVSPFRLRTRPPSLTTVPESTTVQRWPNGASRLSASGGDLARANRETAAVKKSTLIDALDQAQELQELSDSFQNTKGGLSPNLLLERMTRTIADPSKEPTFGGVSLSDSRLKGVGTGGLVGATTQIATAGSVVGRFDLRMSRSKTSSLSVSRDSQGIQHHLVNKAVTKRLGAGVEATVGVTLGGASLVGAQASLNHDLTWKNDASGVILRMPKFDGKTHEQLSEDFISMNDTLLNWRDFEDEGGQPLYKDALEALLHRHPEISISLVEERSTSLTASSNLGIIGGASLPVGNRGGSAVIAGTVGVGTSSTRRSDTLKTTSGTQGIEAISTGRSGAVTAYAATVARLGGAPLDTPHLAGIRAPVGDISAQVTLHQSIDQAGATLLRQPDGSIVAERSVEYSNFSKFETAVNGHREKWIQAGMQAGRWPEGFSESDKRIAANDALDAFMDTAKTRLKSGTVTLNENLDVKPEVCAVLTGNLALEQLARADGRHVEADALRATRETVVADESSYQAFWLKLFDSGSRSKTTGFDVIFQSTRTQTASATHMSDRYPPK